MRARIARGAGLLAGLAVARGVDAVPNLVTLIDALVALAVVGASAGLLAGLVVNCGAVAMADLIALIDALVALAVVGASARLLAGLVVSSGAVAMANLIALIDTLVALAVVGAAACLLASLTVATRAGAWACTGRARVATLIALTALVAIATTAARLLASLSVTTGAGAITRAGGARAATMIGLIACIITTASSSQSVVALVALASRAVAATGSVLVGLIAAGGPAVTCAVITGARLIRNGCGGRSGALRYSAGIREVFAFACFITAAPATTATGVRAGRNERRLVSQCGLGRCCDGRHQATRAHVNRRGRLRVQWLIGTGTGVEAAAASDSKTRVIRARCRAARVVIRVRRLFGERSQRIDVGRRTAMAGTTIRAREIAVRTIEPADRHLLARQVGLIDRPVDRFLELVLRRRRFRVCC